MTARRAVGLLLTGLGLILMLYALASPFIYGKPCIGDCVTKKADERQWYPDTVSAILGWFLLIIGPAVAYGEAPVAIEKAVRREGGGERK